MQIDFGFGGGRKNGRSEKQGRGGEEISKMFHAWMFHARDYRTDGQRFARGKSREVHEGAMLDSQDEGVYFEEVFHF